MKYLFMLAFLLISKMAWAETSVAIATITGTAELSTQTYSTFLEYNPQTQMQRQVIYLIITGPWKPLISIQALRDAQERSAQSERYK